MTVSVAPGGDVDARAGELIGLAAGNLRTRRRAEAQQLEIARAWATLHLRPEPSLGNDVRVRDIRRIGAEQTPVDAYACAELAEAIEVHPLAAQQLMADALDLACRMPQLWRQVQDLALDAWVARKIIRMAGHLDRDDAADVDAAIAPVAGTLPRGRLLSLAEGRIVEADPQAWDDRVAANRRSLGVFLGRANREGIRTVYCRLKSLDALRLYALVTLLAKLLAGAPVTDTPPPPADAPDLEPTDWQPGEEPVDEETVAPEPEPDAEPAPTTDFPETPADDGMDAHRAAALGLLADPQAALDVLAGRDPRGGKAVVYVHTSLDALAGHGISRVEDLGPHTKAMLVDLLGHDHITLKPVIDLNDGAAADCYEVPASIAERLHLAMPADVFPWAESLSRHTDIDHTEAYDEHGPPDQTRIGNLGKLTRRHHRIKTHARGWHVEQLPGYRFRWTTPHGRQVIVDRDGTHPVPTTGSGSTTGLRIDFVFDPQVVLAA